MIQGQGPKVYIINVTIAVGDKGIDLASYDTSGHYVDYLGGVPLRAGIWVGGGAEGGFIRKEIVSETHCHCDAIFGGTAILLAAGRATLLALAHQRQSGSAVLQQRWRQ